MRHGDPRLTQRVDRLLKTKTADDDSGCLIWLGAKTKAGYPTVVDVSGGKRSSTTVTRLVFVDRHRDLLPGEVVHHRCSNPSCVRPEHLEGVMSTENSIEMFQRKSLNATIDYAEEFITDSEDALHDVISQDREVSDDQDERR